MAARPTVGYFGASTGAAAALHAAADPADPVRALVCRGGRPDRRAEAELRCESRLDVVPGATHLFEGPGDLDAVAQSAAAWFTAHFRDGGEPDAARVAGPRRGSAPR